MAVPTSARSCPFFKDGRCSCVTFAAHSADPVVCSLQVGTFEDCPIYKTAPRS
jgi:hypothetical protein